MNLEAEYNNRARVPEHPELLAGFQRDAATFRDAAKSELDLAYGDHQRHLLDMFWPETDRGGPVVVFIHGGYWQALDKNSFSHMARGVSVSGMPVAVPSYRLCPDVQVADIISDLHRACIWLWRKYQRKLVVAGHSAGGHLAAAMVATDWSGQQAPDDLVRAGLGISGIYDLRPLIATSVNDKLGLDDQSACEASPLLWTSPAGRTFEAWAGGDESPEYLRQSQTLAACWSGCGVNCRYAVEAGTNHFTVISALGRPDSSMTRALTGLCR